MSLESVLKYIKDSEIYNNSNGLLWNRFPTFFIPGRLLSSVSLEVVKLLVHSVSDSEKSFYLKLLVHFDRFDEAFVLLDEIESSSREGFREAFGDVQLDWWFCRGLVFVQQKEFSTALPCFEKAFHITTTLFGTSSTHSSVFSICLEVARIYSSLRQYPQALTVLEKCLILQKLNMVEEYSDVVGETLTCIGNVFLAQGEQQKAADRCVSAVLHWRLRWQAVTVLCV